MLMILSDLVKTSITKQIIVDVSLTGHSSGPRQKYDK